MPKNRQANIVTKGLNLSPVNQLLAWQDGGGWPIDFLKIDAEGFDLDVLLAIFGHTF